RLVRANAVLGSSDDDDWRARLEDAVVDLLHLDEIEGQKSRLRKPTAKGGGGGLSLGRGPPPQGGGGPFLGGGRRTAHVAHVELKEVLAIDLAGLVDEPEVAMARCVEVGHAIGNQHWPAVVKGLRVYVPLTVARDVMASVMKTHSFEGVTFEFVPGAEVIP